MMSSPLPSAVRIRPLDVPVEAKVSIPGSKSLTNRALILAALSQGTVELRGALWAEDTELMVEALRNLGFIIQVEEEKSNPCNRTLVVEGRGGEIPAGEADLFVGTAGTAARFLAALCGLGRGRYRLHGTPRMHERPMREVFDALRSLGARVEDREGKLPAVISGPIGGGKVSVSTQESSQFASAMILLSHVIPLEVESSVTSYVEMTRSLLREWKVQPAIWEVEMDASSASYFVALQRLHPGGKLEFQGRLDLASTQMDARFLSPAFWPPPVRVSRKTDLGDSIMTLVVAAAGYRRPLHLVEAGNMRKQECDRLAALRAELSKCGVPVVEEPDGLRLESASSFHEARIHTYRDHRMAMCFSVLGSLDVFGKGEPWLVIEDPQCVNKTFPNFFEVLEDAACQSYRHAGRPYRSVVLTEGFHSVFATRDI